MSTRRRQPKPSLEELRRIVMEGLHPQAFVLTAWGDLQPLGQKGVRWRMPAGAKDVAGYRAAMGLPAQRGPDRALVNARENPWPDRALVGGLPAIFDDAEEEHE